MVSEGATAKEVADALGIGLTKAYDIVRHPVMKIMAPDSEQCGGGVADTSDHAQIKPEVAA